MLQHIDLERILIAWVIPPKRKALVLEWFRNANLEHVPGKWPPVFRSQISLRNLRTLDCDEDILQCIDFGASSFPKCDFAFGELSGLASRERPCFSESLLLLGGSRSSSGIIGHSDPCHLWRMLFQLPAIGACCQSLTRISVRLARVNIPCRV
jgi:hypothetical protein